MRARQKTEGKKRHGSFVLLAAHEKTAKRTAPLSAALALRVLPHPFDAIPQTEVKAGNDQSKSQQSYQVLFDAAELAHIKIGKNLRNCNAAKHEADRGTVLLSCCPLMKNRTVPLSVLHHLNARTSHHASQKAPWDQRNSGVTANGDTERGCRLRTRQIEYTHGHIYQNQNEAGNGQDNGPCLLESRAISGAPDSLSKAVKEKIGYKIPSKQPCCGKEKNGVRIG